MHTFAQKPKATQQTPSAKSTILGRGHSGQSPAVRSILHVQRTLGNQAVQRMVRTDAGHPEADVTGSASPRVGHDFSRIPIYPPAAGAIQPKLAINEPGDSCEQDADRVAEHVMRTPEPQLQRAWPRGGGCPTGPTAQPGREPERVQATRVQPGHTGQGAAPPIVHAVLRAPGQPLEPATRDFMEPRFGHDFSRIRIHTDAEAANASAALGAAAFTVGHHIAFARERFRPGTAHGRRLVAHELTHAVQQAATSPHIALQPDRSRAAPKPGRSGVVGGSLGWNDSNEHVLVTREVGGTQGYDDRRQAIAVARLAKAEPAAVVQDANLKWHAVELNADFDRDPAKWRAAQMDASAAEESPFRDVYGLPPLARIEQSRQEVDDLTAKVARLNDLEQQYKTDPEYRKAVKGADQPLLPAIEAERSKTIKLLTQASQTHAALVLGVPEDEIELAGSYSGRKFGKLNILGLPGPDSAPSGHDPMGGERGFEEGRQSAIWMTRQRLGEPGAPGTLFHEVTHLKDWQLAQEWVAKYEETGGLFVKSATGPFRDWLNAQVKKGRLTKADAEMVLMEAADAPAYTEARANVRTFLAELQSGAPDLATKSLVTYVKKYANPAAESEVVAALVAESKSAYKKMSKDMQKQYDAAVAAAKKENPESWISKLDFSKLAGK